MRAARGESEGRGAIGQGLAREEAGQRQPGAPRERGLWSPAARNRSCDSRGGGGGGGSGGRARAGAAGRTRAGRGRGGRRCGRRWADGHRSRLLGSVGSQQQRRTSRSQRQASQTQLPVVRSWPGPALMAHRTRLLVGQRREPAAAHARSARVHTTGAEARQLPWQPLSPAPPLTAHRRLVLRLKQCDRQENEWPLPPSFARAPRRAARPSLPPLSPASTGASPLSPAALKGRRTRCSAGR